MAKRVHFKFKGFLFLHQEQHFSSNNNIALLIFDFNMLQLLLLLILFIVNILANPLETSATPTTSTTSTTSPTSTTSANSTNTVNGQACTVEEAGSDICGANRKSYYVCVKADDGAYKYLEEPCLNGKTCKDDDALC